MATQKIKKGNKKQPQLKMTFSDEAAWLILEAFGYEFNKNGLIAEIGTGELAMTTKGETISKSEFGGIMKGPNGGPRFLKGDLCSLMDFVDEFPKEKL